MRKDSKPLALEAELFYRSRGEINLGKINVIGKLSFKDDKAFIC